MLSAGARLGPYEIVSPLGAGGMGEVYRARDTKLGRDVALKVLPEAFTADVDRLARFEREARLLAQLNHPNVATLHGLEESDGQSFLVMELVEGKTLAEHIARGALPFEEARTLFVQIAAGLEAAHDRGIVHRDLKPGNVKIAPDGTVKIVDFGLARESAVDPSQADVSRSPTLTRDATEAGLILGTAPYMSPEQARGKVVDRRTDIWAFGACLYEALTRRRAFGGETVTDVLASIVQREPDWSALPARMPRRLRELVQRCLRRDVARRLQHIGDARLELDEGATEEEAIPPPRARRPQVPRLAAAFAVGLAGGAALMWGLGERAVAPEPSETQLIQLTANPAEQTLLSAALSPDGKYLAYADLTGVRVQVTATGETHDVPLPEGLVVDEVDWFPDGTTLLLGSASCDLWKGSMFGGPPRKVAEQAFRAVVSPDGTRVAYLSAAEAPSRRVVVMGTDGEDTRSVAQAVGGESFWELAWSPDGARLLVGVWRMVGSKKGTSVEAVNVVTGDRRAVLSDPRLWQNWRAVLPFIWTSSGRLIYARHEDPPGERSSNLWALDIDTEAVVRGTPTRVTQLPGVNLRDLSESVEGRIAFLAGRNASDVYVATLASDLDDARPVTFDERDDYPSTWLPDGRALVVVSQRGPRLGLWRLDLDTAEVTLLGSQEAEIEQAEVSGDGAWLLYRTSGEWLRTPIAGGPSKTLLSSGEEVHCAVPVQRCVVGERDDATGEYIFSELDLLAGKGRELAWIPDDPPFTNWDVSPDGERVAIVHLSGKIRLLDLVTGAERVLEDDAWFFGEFPSFGADGEDLYVDGSRTGRPAARMSLLRVSLGDETEAQELRHRRNVWHVMPKASPDGRYLAFGAMTFTANAWMLTEGRRSARTRSQLPTSRSSTTRRIEPR